MYNYNLKFLAIQDFAPALVPDPEAPFPPTWIFPSSETLIIL